MQELRLPGMPAEPPVLIASMLEGSLDLRDAAAGRLSRTVERPDRTPTHAHESDEEGGS